MTDQRIPSARTDIALCYGTRPQVIKASVLGRVLRERWSVLSIDTGQHYDYELNELLYDQLSVPEADHYLDIGSASHAEQTAAILTRAAQQFERAKPRCVIVIGDTNSTLGCALAAVKLRIPVVHVEAGLRAADMMMAEEINRRAVDAIATLLCAPSQTAMENLRSEGLADRSVFTGDVAYDVLRQNAGRADLAVVAPDFSPGQYVFATLHRAELTDDVQLLADALDALSALTLPVLMAVHPRTRAVIEQAKLNDRVGGRLRLSQPTGYLESLALIRNARLVVTDSGGLQREAYWLGTPCVTLRVETEWSETIERGANRLVSPVSVRTLPSIAAQIVSETTNPWDRDAYGNGHAAQSVTDALSGLLGSGSERVVSPVIRTTTISL